MSRDPDKCRFEARPDSLFPGSSRAYGVRPTPARRTAPRKARRRCASSCPSRCRQVYRRAVDRLPELSVIIYDDEGPKQSDPEQSSNAQTDRAVYLPVEVTDPFVEALRTAKEIGAQTEFLDPDIGERPHVDESYPHPYALEQLGLEKYIGAYRVHPVLDPASRRYTPRGWLGNCKASTRKRLYSLSSRSICWIRCCTPWNALRRGRSARRRGGGFAC